MREFTTKYMLAAQQWAADAVARRHWDEEGQTLVEYALLLVLIAIVVIIVLTLLGSNINNIFSTIASQMSA